MENSNSLNSLCHLISVMPFLLAFFSIKIGRVWLINYIIFTGMFLANLLAEKYQSEYKRVEGVTATRVITICLI